jgi:hypothetical protein
VKERFRWHGKSEDERQVDSQNLDTQLSTPDLKPWPAPEPIDMGLLCSTGVCMCICTYVILYIYMTLTFGNAQVRVGDTPKNLSLRLRGSVIWLHFEHWHAPRQVIASDKTRKRELVQRGGGGREFGRVQQTCTCTCTFACMLITWTLQFWRVRAVKLRFGWQGKSENERKVKSQNLDP